MSARTIKIVACDYPGCLTQTVVEQLSWRGLPPWRYRNRKDYCPAHAENIKSVHDPR